jgi:hypothetical protein
MDWWMDGLVDRWIGGWMDWWMDGLVDRWIGGSMDWWIDGLVDRWIGGLVDGWVARSVPQHAPAVEFGKMDGWREVPDFAFWGAVHKISMV